MTVGNSGVFDAILDVLGTTWYQQDYQDFCSWMQEDPRIVKNSCHFDQSGIELLMKNEVFVSAYLSARGYEIEGLPEGLTGEEGCREVARKLRRSPVERGFVGNDGSFYVHYRLPRVILTCWFGPDDCMYQARLKLRKKFLEEALGTAKQ